MTLACDHALSLYLSSQGSNEAKKITPDLRLP